MGRLYKTLGYCGVLGAALGGMFVMGGDGDAHAKGGRRAHKGSHEHGKSPFEFALIGDTRYNDEGSAHFGPMQADINADRKVQFVMHAGDILGGTPCSDELHYERLNDFLAFEKPLIYTPGDNEWTDCHYVFLGLYNPLERLAKLREIFFPFPTLTLGGDPMDVQSQSQVPGFEDYVENAMWVKSGVVFATIHMVGSDNGLAPWNRSFGGSPVYDPEDTVETPREDRLEEVAARIEAGVAWIDRAFALANQIDSPGVFLLSHANPGFITRFETDPIGEGFVDWQAAIVRHAVNFEKPVVLAHGDTHTPRIDKPMTAATVEVEPEAPSVARVENFTRVETFGYPDTHWTRVIVDPKSDNVFSFEMETVEANRRQFAPIP